MNSFVGTCHVCANPQFSRNFFGPISEIAGKKLDVLERNSRGDCLSMLPDHSNIVDVDRRDVVKFEPATLAQHQDWASIVATMLRR